MVHCQCGPVPQLVRCFAAGALGRCPIEDVDRRVDGLPPERTMEFTCLEHAPGHPDHCLVPPLDDAILLLHIWCHELAPNSELGAVHREFSRPELSPTIGTQGEEFPSTLALSCCLDPFDGSWSSVLGGEQRHPHVPVVIVDEEQKVAVAAWGTRADWPVEVAVQQLEQVDIAL